MEDNWRNICICYPPLKRNQLPNMIYTTYDLDAICPHCKAPFRECKPELVASNIEAEQKFMIESLNLSLEEMREERKEIEYYPLHFNINDIILYAIFILVFIAIVIFTFQTKY